MSAPTQLPPGPLVSERVTKDRRTGRLLIGSSLYSMLATVIIALMAGVIVSQTGAIGRLSTGLTQQRDQFVACKDKPAKVRGCTQPVAAEPSVIVKQGSRGLPGLPGAAGANGLTGPQGPQGPIGPQGPAGPPGAAGKQGPPPGCALLSTACVGATGQRGLRGETGPAGPAGPQGAQGERGLQGETGPAGPAGQQGAQGEMGVQGPRGVGTSSSQCVDDDTADGSHWLITYSDGAQETSKGPCRIKLP